MKTERYGYINCVVVFSSSLSARESRTIHNEFFSKSVVEKMMVIFSSRSVVFPDSVDEYGSMRGYSTGQCNMIYILQI